MIIVCSGSDTYRAREKARELVDAFRKKHDPRGLSTESAEGITDLKSLLPRLGTTSMFTKKKMVRADGCLKKLKLAEVKILVSSLKNDAEDTILLSLEEKVDPKITEELKKGSFFHYPFETLNGDKFARWLMERAASFNLSREVILSIAAYTDGDPWYAINEMAKHAVMEQGVGQKVGVEEGEFQIVDAFLAGGKSRTKIYNHENYGIFGLIYKQLITHIKVNSGQTAGVAPFLVRKMRQIKCPNARQVYKKILLAMVLSRSGLAKENELDSTM
jgi:hypothetical protein